MGRFSFNFNIFGNLWEQVAKFRAGRKVWATNLKERYKVKNPRNLWLRGLFAGGGSGLTKAEPENNIIRGAYYALAAALAGAQTTACQILMEEVGLRDTVDPLAGSYFIETLTKQMEEKIWEEMEEIEKRGGIVECIKNGYVQRKLARQAYEFERALERGEIIKVGVNKYVTEEEQEVELHEYNEAWAEQKIRELRELKRSRDQKPVTDTLKALEKAARDGENVMPYLVACCRAYCTVGEMADVFRGVFGTFQEPSIF